MRGCCDGSDVDHLIVVDVGFQGQFDDWLLFLSNQRGRRCNTLNCFIRKQCNGNTNRKISYFINVL
ncbi:hypothetical protein Hanom_Chr04g00366701 [Helianthus anomalus]